MQKFNVDAVAVVHRLFFEGKRKKGGFDKVLENFSNNKKTILLIEHPLVGINESFHQYKHTLVSLVQNGRIGEPQLKIVHKKKNNLLNWAWELFFNVSVILRNTQNTHLFMATDPLNGFPGILTRFKFKKSYLHIVDYSEERFKNKILNLIYKFLLFLCIKHFDVVGVVSTRTMKKFRSLGVNKNKLFYIPNSPVFEKLSIPQNRRHTIICTGGGIIAKYEYNKILDILLCVKGKFPDVILYAVGNITEDPQYVSQLKNKIRQKGLDANVVFTEFLENEDYWNTLLQAAVGVSFYSEAAMYYMKYGDPIKTWEYVLCGIPAIVDGKSSSDNALVFHGAGFIADTADSACEIIKKLFSDKKLYQKCQESCLKYAEEMDKKIILERLENKLF